MLVLPAYAIVVLGLAVAFYWYQVRPSRVLASCSQWSTGQATVHAKSEIDHASNDLIKAVSERDLAEKGSLFMNYYDNYFRFCLRGQGLER